MILGRGARGPNPDRRRAGELRRAVRRGRGRRRHGRGSRAPHRRGARRGTHHQPDAGREPGRGRHHPGARLRAVRGARARPGDRPACSTRTCTTTRSRRSATCRGSTSSCWTSPDPTANHTGARGLAEPPIIPTAPAIANAVANAIGVEVHELPLTPWRVLGAFVIPSVEPCHPERRTLSSRAAARDLL